MSSPPLTWNEALSGVAGSISLAAWIFLLVPQLVENYRLGSADGVSLTFLLIWALGDAASLAGALWAGLVPTVIALAIYFCFADTVLILQCLYYNSMRELDINGKDNEEEEQGSTVVTHANGHAAAETTASEHTPLLRDAPPSAPTSPTTIKRRLTDVSCEHLGQRGARRRSSVASRRRLSAVDDPLGLLDAPTPRRAWIKNTVSTLLIFVAGTAGWAIAYSAGAWQPVPTGPADGGDEAVPTPLGASILGYTSAVLYLGARVPQIIKNQRERSCDGLSLLFFILSIVGNATYGAGILFHSVDRAYFLTNLPWLIGSWGTIAEDALIFAQFSKFGNVSESDEDNETAAE